VKRIPRAGDEARHALEHSGKPLLVCAESNENGAMVLDISVGHVAAKDVPKIHPDPCGPHASLLAYSRVSTLSGLVRPIIRSCLLDRQSFPRSNLVFPLLKAKGPSQQRRELFQATVPRWEPRAASILRAIDEAGKDRDHAGMANSRFFR